MTFGRGIETISCGFFTDPACKRGGRIESLPSARASASFWTVRNQTKSHRRRVVDCKARPSCPQERKKHPDQHACTIHQAVRNRERSQPAKSQLQERLEERVWHRRQQP